MMLPLLPNLTLTSTSPLLTPTCSPKATSESPDRVRPRGKLIRVASHGLQMRATAARKKKTTQSAWLQRDQVPKCRYPFPEGPDGPRQDIHQIIKRRPLKPALAAESHAEQNHHSDCAKQDM